MQEKSADCGKNCTFLVESQKGCTKGQCTKYKGQDNSQKSKVESQKDVQRDNVQSTKGKAIVRTKS